MARSMVEDSQITVTAVTMMANGSRTRCTAKVRRRLFQNWSSLKSSIIYSENLIQKLIMRGKIKRGHSRTMPTTINNSTMESTSSDRCMVKVCIGGIMAFNTHHQARFMTVHVTIFPEICQDGALSTQAFSSTTISMVQAKCNLRMKTNTKVNGKTT